MSVFLQRCSTAFRSGRWCLAVAAVLAFGLSGCKNWETHDDGLRHSDLSKTAHEARSKRDDGEKKKAADDPWMSEKANQVSRDLD
jgi:hypothetical protein